MTDIPILGEQNTRHSEHITVEHPIFTEIAAAISELLRRTEILAAQQVALAQVLADNGLINIEEEAEVADPEA